MAQNAPPKIMTAAERQAAIKFWRNEARKLIRPSLKIIKRAIEDPDPRKAAANLREIEKCPGVKNLRERIAEIYRGEPQEGDDS